MTRPKICARCGHAGPSHCRGGQWHTNHKEDARMVPAAERTGTHQCISRHCTYPLCSCVNFTEEACRS